MAETNASTRTSHAELFQQHQDAEEQPQFQSPDQQPQESQSMTADRKSVDSQTQSTTTSDPQPSTNKSRRLAKRAARAAKESDITQLSKSKQRRELDVLNRLRWDERFDAADIIIGYEDRHSERGIIEIAMEDWERESTADEFIPLHRIRYFARRGEGEMLWHRALRIDRVFGEG